MSISVGSLLIYLFGLISGIYALTRVRQFGRQGILAPAIVGVVLNSLIVAAFVIVIITATAG